MSRSASSRAGAQRARRATQRTSTRSFPKVLLFDVPFTLHSFESFSQLILFGLVLNQKAFGASIDVNPVSAEQDGGEASGSCGHGGGDSIGSASERGAAASGRSSRRESRLSRISAPHADSGAEGAASAFGGSASAPLAFGGLAPPVVLCCVLSGVMWNVGNICSILVTVSPLGLTIGECFTTTSCTVHANPSHNLTRSPYCCIFGSCLPSSHDRAPTRSARSRRRVRHRHRAV